ncbi:MAG: lipoprotein [Hyphomicrobiales bacterium]
MSGDLATYLRQLAILVLIAGALTACGRKGSLEPPPSASATKSPGAQAAQTAADADEEKQQQASAPAATGGISGFRAKKPPPIRPPNTPSILDPILE